MLLLLLPHFPCGNRSTTISSAFHTFAPSPGTSEASQNLSWLTFVGVQQGSHSVREKIITIRQTKLCSHNSWMRTDIIKVRLQTTTRYTGAVDAATKIFKDEGPLAFYKVGGGGTEQERGEEY